MRKLLRLTMTLLGLMLLASCGKEYDDGELWTKVNSLDRRVGDIETTLSRLNSDIDAIRIAATASESGLSVTSVSQTAEGWRVTYNNGSSFTLPNLNDGQSPFIQGGNWWIGSTDTGVKAAGTTGRSVFIRNNTWWVGNTDTGISIFPMDGRTPRIGPNNNWWVGDTDTGIPAMGIDGLSPHIGTNGNWWFGTTDSGVSAGGQGGSTANVPILGIDLYTDGRYYWTQTLNGTKDWLRDSYGHMMPVSGSDAQRPIIRVNVEGYWTISYDGGITYVYILDGNGQRVALSNGGCPCKSYFTLVRYIHPYLILVLTDGTVIRIRIGGGGGGIPDDPTEPTPDPGPNPDPLPNPTPTPEDRDNEIVVRLDMTGIQDPYTGEWLKLYGTGLDNQNVWLDLEDTPKGILVINNEEDETQEAQVKLDIIFTVDNSGTMSEEADVVARDIKAWAQKLQNSGLDVKFACVGYDDPGRIVGGINFCDATELSSWLDSNGTGTNRTKHFGGYDATRLSNSASRCYYPGGECGAIAIRFADENMTFRAGANRVYINFTDEPNQPNGNADYSVEWFRDQSNWSPAQGTIHTVYSGSSQTWTTLYAEDPTLMSTYTGGTVFRTNGSFTGVNLDDLTVTEAMKHSYVIYFRVPERYFDGQPHAVRITVITPDGHVRAQRTFYITFSTL